jgi:hypothetical protein
VKLLTTVQIVLEIAHDEDFAPADVARVAADVARDAIAWTDNLELNRAIEGVEDPVRVVSAIVIASPPPCAK